MKRSPIQRGFVLSYLAIAFLSILTGLLLRYSSDIFASDQTVTATATPVPTQNCQPGTTVKVTDLSDEDISIFGQKAHAYIVHNAQAKDFKIIVSAKEISRAGGGGVVSFTYGFQNLNNFAYGDSKDGTMTLNWKNAAKDQKLIFDQRNVSVASGKYWHQTKQATVLDYTADIKSFMLNGGTDGLAHPQSCIDRAINLASDFAAPVAGKFSVTLKPGFNTVSAPIDSVLGTQDVLATEPLTDAGMYIFDFNRLGQKAWRSTAKGAEIPFFFGQIGYYVYNPGAEQTIELSVNPSSYVAGDEEQVVIRRGWNLLSNPNTASATSLADFDVNALRKGVDAACLGSGCFEKTTLRDLLAGDPSTSRAYGYIFEITNGNSTDPNQAFTRVKVDSSNIDSVTISPRTVFWFYLFE